MPDSNNPKSAQDVLGRRPIGHGSSRFIPGEKPKNARGTLKRLIAYYLKEGKMLFIVAFIVLMECSLNLTVPNLTRLAIQAVKGPGDIDYKTISYMVAFILICYITGGFLNFLEGWLMADTSQKIIRNMRQALFDKYQKLPLTYHDTHTHGELMSRLTNDIDNISSIIAQSTIQILAAIVTVLGSIIFMLCLSPILTLVTIITVPLVFLLIKIVTGKTKVLFLSQQRYLGELNGTLEEGITGLKTIKAFNCEQKMIDKFRVTNEQLKTCAVRAQIWSGYVMPFMNVITNLGFSLVIGVGSALAIVGFGNVGISIIVSFTQYSRMATRPLNDVAGMFNTLQSALAGAERVFEVLDQPDETPDIPGAIDIGIPKGDVRFEHVMFAYIPGVNVLNNVNFKVDSGKKIALVGPTGAGKTTIVNLLTRFYDVTGGKIYIDDKEITAYTRDSLRRAFSVVLQDTCLFTGSIADNIRYGKPEATDEQVIDAAKAANAHQFIIRLRDGYKTTVDGQAENLSQGQRQLIAISRAVLCSAPILILDEATSSVDTRTEKNIQSALLRLSSGRTSFVIAHRLSTIKDADLIMVVNDSRIIESGTHAELLSKNGFYTEMYRSQTEGYIPEY